MTRKMWLSQEYLTPSKSEPPLEAGEAPCEFIGEEVQRLSVVQNLPQLLEGNEQLCMQRVVPRVQLALPNASTEFHIAASSTFKTILEKKLVHPRTFTQTFLQSILSSIDSRDPVVANAWLETLLDVIDLLPSDVVKTDILPIAVNKGQISQKLNSRITACKLLGKISTRVDLQTLKKDTLPIILSLCQDIKAEVRGCICSQLPFVAQGLGAEGVKPNILPLLVELASDEEAIVRLSAVEAIVCMLPHLQSDTLKNIIVPLVKKMCESSIRNEDNVMVVLAQVFGELCLGLESSLTLPEKRWFIGYYQQLAELGLRASDREFGATRKNMPDLVPLSNNADRFVECRHHCAFHFPAMTVFCTSTSDNFDEQLYPVFCGLACDPYFEVRRTIACGLHEVSRVLGNSNGMVKSELVKLLRDDSEQVLSGLIPNLSKTLTLLTKSGTIKADYMDTSTLEIGRALLKCESEVSVTNNWRLHEMLVRQLECLHMVLPSEFIHSYFTPVLFTRIHRARQLPVRMAATNTLLVFMRYNTKGLQRTDIRSRIISELCNGHSCYSRLSFMRLCSQAMELFSKKYFKDHFYLSVLERAEDVVPNIRLIFVKMLPKLKMCLRMPSDKKYFAALESSIRKIISVEKDKDVLSALDKSLTQLDKIECTLDTAHITPHSTKEDQDDFKKMEEETRLTMIVAKHADGKISASQVAVPSGGSAGPAARNVPGLAKPPPPRYGQPAAVPTAGPNAGPNAGMTAANQKRVASPMLQRGDPSDISRGSVTSAARARSEPPGGRLSIPNKQMTVPPAKDKDLLQSLEAEFFRDAGVRIPRQFASSALPLRVREGAKREKGATNQRQGTPAPDNNRRRGIVERLHTSTQDGDPRGDVTNQTKRLSLQGKEEQSYRGPLNRGTGDSSLPTNQSKRLSFQGKEDQNYRSPLNQGAGEPSLPITQSKRLSLQGKDDQSHRGPLNRGAGDSSLVTSRTKRLSYHGKEEPNYRSPLSQGSGDPLPATNRSKRMSYQGDSALVANQSRRISYHGKEEPNYRSPLSQGTGDSTLPTNQSKRLSFQGKEDQNYRSLLSQGTNDSSLPTNQSKRLSFQGKEDQNYRSLLSQGTNDSSLPTNQSKRLSFQGKEDQNYRSLLSQGTNDSSLPTNQSKRLSFQGKEDQNYRSLLSQGTNDSSLPTNQSKRLSFQGKEDQNYRSLSSQGTKLRTNAGQTEKARRSLGSKEEGQTRLRRPGFAANNNNNDDVESASRNRAVRAARSNHSSPGNSRSGSPGSVAGRGRHLTAPNSRAASPTGTLHSYLGSIKLTEPSSRLPVRKK